MSEKATKESKVGAKDMTFWNQHIASISLAIFLIGVLLFFISSQLPRNIQTRCTDLGNCFNVETATPSAVILFWLGFTLFVLGGILFMFQIDKKYGIRSLPMIPF